MHWQYNQYGLLSLVAAVISLTLVVYIWQRRTAPGAMAFFAMMLAVAVWSLGSFMELGSAGLSTKVFWAKFQQVGIAVLPPVWLAFALQYTGRGKWLTRRKLILLTIMPLVTLALVWTNDLHHLFWKGIRLDNSGPYPMMLSTQGIWFWINLVFSYLLITFGIFCLIKAYFRAAYPYRAQASVLLVGAIAPLAASLLSLSDLEPFSYMDTTPFGFTVSGLALAWGLFLLRLLDVVPVARDSVIKDMPIGMIVLNPLNRIVDINPAAEKLIGKPAAEIVGQPAPHALAGKPDLAEQVEKVMHGNAEIVMGEDNTNRCYELNVSPVWDQRGRVTGRLVLLHDISERKRAEETLTRRLRFERAISRISSRFVGAADMDEAINASLWDLGSISGAARSHLFLSNDDRVFGTNTHEWCAEGIMPKINDLQNLPVSAFPWWMKKLHHRETICIPDVSNMLEEAETEKQLLEHHGISSLFAVPVIIGSRVAGFIEFEDVTQAEVWTDDDLVLLRICSELVGNALERKLAEDRIRETNDELCRTLDQLKTSQAQLMQSEKMVAIGQLVSGVAHELNNPLMAISCLTELMLNYVEDEMAREDLQNLQRNTVRANTIVTNLLSFARKHEPQRKHISVNDSIQTVLNLRAYELNLDYIEIITDLDAALPNILADFQQLQQVFLNFLINAEQAMRAAHGRGTLLIRTEQVDEIIRITFNDSGPGIPVDVLDHIFEPFFTTKDVGKGTGLGLSICYGIIQEHNGQIYAESNESGGATFTVELPIMSNSVGCT